MPKIEVTQKNWNNRRDRTFTYHVEDDAVDAKLSQIRDAYNMNHTEVRVDGVLVDGPGGKHVTVTVSLSTNPQVQGRYFVDVRDTTFEPDTRNARQVTTRTRDHDDVVEFVGQLTREAKRHGIRVTVKDTTDEIQF